MIGIAHGYGLAGAGSNLWTRETVAALCDNGETVHLMCQEPDPERFDFITELWVYDDDGEPERRLERSSPRPGRCIVHRPALDVLPTYVRPDRESDYVRSILDLDDAALEDYLERNVRTFRRIGRDHGVGAWHVNHTILLSEALRRVKAADGTGYAVMPHGSALEYIVRHDPRMEKVARRALADADRIFALNEEIRERLARYFPDLDLEPRTVTVRVGVDTERFRPVPRPERPGSVEALARALGDVGRGHEPGHSRVLSDALRPDLTHEEFQSALEPALDYPTGRPDTDVEEKLRAIDWDRARIVTFVGRLIPAKGVASLVVALPRILERHPDVHLVLVGAGWLREYMEAFVRALAAGQGDLAARIIDWAAERRQEGARPSASAYLNALRENGTYDDYARAAAEVLDPERLVFTGFLEHDLLAHVFPLADVAVFPSAVAEASPLVVPEAAACGCLPMGTDFAGMHHSLQSLAPRLPERLRPLMRLRPEPEHTVEDIIDRVSRALDEDADVTDVLRAAAVEEYDWHGIARTVADELKALSAA